MNDVQNSSDCEVAKDIEIISKDGLAIELLYNRVLMLESYNKKLNKKISDIEYKLYYDGMSQK